ncbi:MAG TPA: PQQ-binding-like beta-propeller repeat protein, partial [Terriglobia bacterium]|nr:PQQ-binding-like beta-propeller repeat protein [Terriglobia bacterium]
MNRKTFFAIVAVLAAIGTGALAQVKNFVPVTKQMLLNPSPDDWLMYSRTYDAQRFSPLNQITKQNVGKLTQVWKNELAAGTIEIIPLVHNGVMYVEVPVRENEMNRIAVQALDATNGNLIWQYVRPTGNAARPKTLAIFEDVVIFAAPDNY